MLNLYTVSSLGCYDTEKNEYTCTDLRILSSIEIDPTLLLSLNKLSLFDVFLLAYTYVGGGLES